MSKKLSYRRSDDSRTKVSKLESLRSSTSLDVGTKVSKKGRVRLYTTSVLYHGKVSKKAISLIYETKGSSPIHIDLTSLRPDPLEYLKIGKTYEARLEFDPISLSCDDKEGDVQILRIINISSGGPHLLKIVNIR